MLLFFLAGCGASGKTVAPPSAEPVSEQVSSLQEFVGAARIGDSRHFSGTEYGDVNVTVVSDYFAASGRRCRMVSVETGGYCDFETVFCLGEDGVWAETPRIWNRCSQ